MTNRLDTLKIAQADLGEAARHMRYADDAIRGRGVSSNSRKHAKLAIVVLEEITAKLKRAFVPEGDCPW